VQSSVSPPGDQADIHLWSAYLWRRHPELIRSLHRIPAGATLWRAALDWLLIALAVLLAMWQGGVLTYLVALLVIGACQGALAVLAHEAAHYRFARSHGLNDLLGELCLAWPLLTSLRRYRSAHRLHHRHLNTDLDPDWHRNQPQRLGECRSVRQRLLLLSGIGDAWQLLKTFHGESEETNTLQDVWLIGRLLFLSLVLLAFWYSGHIILLIKFWLLPYFLIFLPMMRFRGVSDHWGLESATGLGAARHVDVGLIAACVCYPHNINYHLAHHLFPGVPACHLPAIHQLLLSEPDVRTGMQISRGALSVLRELMTYQKPPAPGTHHYYG
jgi:fatty acid desaturase